MPIFCQCPKCGKRLKAADSAAGKKAKCPDCGAAVPIPAKSPPASDDDEFDLQKLNVDEGVEGPVEDDRIPCPMCGEMIVATARRCRFCGEDLHEPTHLGRKKSTRAASAMPLAIIVAMAIEVLLILLNAIGIAGNLSQQNVAGAVGSGFRILIEIAVLAGLWQRQNSARVAAIILSALGIVFMMLCGGGLLLVDQNNPILAQLPAQAMPLILAILVLQAILFVVSIVTLMTRPAQEFCDH